MLILIIINIIIINISIIIHYYPLLLVLTLSIIINEKCLQFDSYNTFMMNSNIFFII